MNSDKTTVRTQPPERELLSMICCFRLTPEDMAQLDRLGLLCDSDRSKIVRECLATAGQISVIKPLTEAVRTFYTACARTSNLCTMVNGHIDWIVRNPFLSRDLIEELLRAEKRLEGAIDAIYDSRKRVALTMEALQDRLIPPRRVSPLLLKTKSNGIQDLEKSRYGRLTCRASVRITETMAKQLAAAAKRRSLKRAKIVRACIITGCIVDVGAELVGPLRTYYRQVEEVGYDLLDVADELQLIAEDPMMAAEEQDRIRAAIGEIHVEEAEVNGVRSKLTEDLAEFLRSLPHLKEETRHGDL